MDKKDNLFPISKAEIVSKDQFEKKLSELFLELNIRTTYIGYLFFFEAVEYAYYHENAGKKEIIDHLVKTFSRHYELIGGNISKVIRVARISRRALTTEILGDERAPIESVIKMARYLKLSSMQNKSEKSDIYTWTCPSCARSFLSKDPLKPRCCPYCLQWMYH